MKGRLLKNKSVKFGLWVSKIARALTTSVLEGGLLTTTTSIIGDRHELRERRYSSLIKFSHVINSSFDEELAFLP